jgi:hypothetical protein
MILIELSFAIRDSDFVSDESQKVQSGALPMKTDGSNICQRINIAQ